MLNGELLNERQKQILQFIKDMLRTKGYPPSVREIGEAVGLSSSSTVHNHLSKLESLGMIRRDPAKPRAIEVLDDSDWGQKAFTIVPLVGQVTAGNPVLAVENFEDVYPFSVDLIGTAEKLFMLRVRGDSMINAGIFHNDYVLVQQQSSASNGDIVVALINSEEATVKRFFNEKTHIRLQPENDSMHPILTTNVTILGKVIGLFRKL